MEILKESFAAMIILGLAVFSFGATLMIILQTKANKSSLSKKRTEIDFLNNYILAIVKIFSDDSLKNIIKDIDQVIDEVEFVKAHAEIEYYITEEINKLLFFRYKAGIVLKVELAMENIAIIFDEDFLKSVPGFNQLINLREVIKGALTEIAEENTPSIMGRIYGGIALTYIKNQHPLGEKVLEFFRTEILKNYTVDELLEFYKGFNHIVSSSIVVVSANNIDADKNRAILERISEQDKIIKDFIKK